MNVENQQDRITRFQRDIDYYESRREQLLQQYPEQWIAILNQDIVGSDTDLKRLLQCLNQAGIPIEKALIEHVSAEDEVLILPA